VDLITENRLDVIKITVDENPYPVNYKGEYHYRTGSTKQLLQGSALTNFLLCKTGKNWDSVPLENVGIDDLDKESFDIFHREAIRSGRMSKDDLKLSNQDLLEKLNLLDGTLLKRAAVLLFHRNPEKWITGSFVKIGFFTAYKLDRQIFASKYELALPKPEKLARQIKMDRLLIEEQRMREIEN